MRLPDLGRFFACALTLALLAAAPAAAGVSTGHSGWAWANPSPQGEGLTDVSFAGSTGYAVGGFGTLLRSADAGETWAGLPSGTVENLTQVGPAGVGGAVTSGTCAVRRTADDGATFRTIDVGGGDTGCGTTVVATSFSDALNGAIFFANGLVLTTADGGVTLSRRTPIPGGPASDLVAVSPTVFWATSGGTIWRSTDGAGSWAVVRTAPGLLKAITFASATVGYAVGDGGLILKTIDAGVTWNQIIAPIGGQGLTDIRCADESLCLLTTLGATTVVRTIDGGATFSQVTPSAQPIRAVAFASPTRVIGVGDAGATVLSDDAGTTWRTVRSDIALLPDRLVAGGGAFAYVVGTQGVALTADGGTTWRTVGIPTPLPIATAAFSDALTGYAQDSGGTLRRTRDGGITWQVLDPGAVSGRLLRIVAAGPRTVLLVTTRGVARSSDGGNTFRAVTSTAFRGTILSAGRILSASGSGRTAFVVARTGILQTTDAGATWRRLRIPRVGGAPPPKIARGDCVAPGTCWILTSGSRAYRTADAGRRWTEVTASIGVPLRLVSDVAAIGPGAAMLALVDTRSAPPGQGIVLATRDRGTTWEPQVVARTSLLALDAAGPRAWGLTPGGQVFTTTSAGRTPVASVLTITGPKAVRPGTRVTITGRLRGAAGGERATIYATGRTPQTVTVASSDTFTISFVVRRRTTLVAQWAGDGVRSGDGSPALVVGLR